MKMLLAAEPHEVPSSCLTSATVEERTTTVCIHFFVVRLEKNSPSFSEFIFVIVLKM